MGIHLPRTLSSPIRSAQVSLIAEADLHGLSVLCTLSEEDSELGALRAATTGIDPKKGEASAYGSSNPYEV